LNYFHFPEESAKTLELLESYGYKTEKTTSLNHIMVLTA
jgi:hypothetical protein